MVLCAKNFWGHGRGAGRKLAIFVSCSTRQPSATAGGTRHYRQAIAIDTCTAGVGGKPTRCEKPLAI